MNQSQRNKARQKNKNNKTKNKEENKEGITKNNKKERVKRGKNRREILNKKQKCLFGGENRFSSPKKQNTNRNRKGLGPNQSKMSVSSFAYAKETFFDNLAQKTRTPKTQ